MDTTIYKAKNHIRVVTAAALFDGHDAAINIFRRILQSSGAEVIHLGHDRSVEEIVETALQEDVQAIAISSYQGGHMEFFKYTVDLLKMREASHIKVFGGGGGVIIPKEIEELEDYGVERIYSPEDGQKLGLQGIINDILKKSDFNVSNNISFSFEFLKGTAKILKKEKEKHPYQVFSKALTALENNTIQEEDRKKLSESVKGKNIPIIGLTGTGGAGKSSLLDELLNRFVRYLPEKNIAVFCIDPTKRKTGGALLGDRIRMNSIYASNIFLRSFATRKMGSSINQSLEDAIKLAKICEFDLIFLETSGIGQGDSQIVDLSDYSLYIMTSEYGSALQLEKIDMLDYADIIVVNKFEKPGSQDALRDIRKQYRRSHQAFTLQNEEIPVFGTIASQFNDSGVNALFQKITKLLSFEVDLKEARCSIESSAKSIIPHHRTRYLHEISECIRSYRKETKEQKKNIIEKEALVRTLNISKKEEVKKVLDKEVEKRNQDIKTNTKQLLDSYNELHKKYNQETFSYYVRGKEFSLPLWEKSLSGSKIPKVALPNYSSDADCYEYMRKENFPGFFPYTAGVFPLKRKWEEPKRQFAGEGPPEKTNARFHFLTKGEKTKRLSTAFDSITLYGRDPALRPDIFGKIGESGVSICTLDDMKKLYHGFDLCAKDTSVSMTINGPAPIILAFFFNMAIEQQIEKAQKEKGSKLTLQEREQAKAYALSTVRGTVQADILKEDQGQNTCIFSLDFALKLMGDVQEYFMKHDIKNFYSISISGYHIAEAGANPISQLAFTLANGFTYVEYFLSRGIPIDKFAPNLSFFFSNGLCPEYSVIGRVARRVWSIAMRDIYKGNERSQKLKYHIQTSGRSLHAQDMTFNDIRTTLQALIAINDNCNSLHTNSFDEAITTPTEEAVRQAMAIQLIINKEFGMTKNENPSQGSYLTQYLTDIVEEAIIEEFDSLSHRGGVTGAMETQYQRSKIQDESMYYEGLKNSGELPVIGVNTYINPKDKSKERNTITLSRSIYEEKVAQVENLKKFQEKNKEEAKTALKKLKDTAISGGNIFEELMQTSKVASLGQITNTLFQVGGKYRRNI